MRKTLKTLGLVIALVLALSVSAVAEEGTLEDGGKVQSSVGVTLTVGPYASVEFTKNDLFNIPLEGHPGLYYSDGHATRNKARDLWNNGLPFSEEKKRGGVAPFDIRTNTTIRVSIESFKADDLAKEEYNWINSPTYFVVSDRDDGWKTRAEIYSGGIGTPPEQSADDFDILLSPGNYENRFNMNAAIWIQHISQQEAQTYKMPLYITVAQEGGP